MNRRSRLVVPVLLCLIVTTFPAASMAQGKKLAWVSEKPVPKWIWRRDRPEANDPLYLRHQFRLPGPVKAARIYFTCDNGATVWINGKQAGLCRDWMHPVVIPDARKLVSTGVNQIAVDAANRGGVAAFVFKLEVESADGRKHRIVSGPDWKLSDRPADNWKLPTFSDASWKVASRDLGAFGVPPWGKPGISGAGGRGNGSAIDPDDITVPAGFRVERLYTVPRNEQGSWVALTTDNNGRLLASDQGNAGLYRITVRESDDGPQVDVQKMPVRVSGAQGLVWHDGALYFNRNGSPLYRVTDSDGDGQLDHAEEISSARGGGEHGNHAVIVGEDGRHLYTDAGNHTDLPASSAISGSRVTTWDEDLLLPREWDANGHARGRLAPGGWVTKFDPATKKHEIISIGYRNQYDITLNRAGDLFTYDADMEWDLGTPWYRPTRINHVVSGSDYGWRSGSGKWPEYYEDSLPAVVNIGPGSPTGVVSGRGARFPARYQDAIYALDWTFGTIYAIHLTPDGAGYTGKPEPFCYGAPLPVTDAIVGTDGALYFTIGGRNSQSALYRVTYVGKEPTEPVTSAIANEEQRALRRRLETFHGRKHSAALTAAWPHLSSKDRWIRHAARVAVESQPVAEWADRVLSESNAQASITGAVALARHGSESHQARLLTTLLKHDPATLTDSQLLGLLRAYALTFIRLGKPTPAQRQQVISELDPLLPHTNNSVNTELVRVLVYLQAPQVVKKSIALISRPEPTKPPKWVEHVGIGRNPGYGNTVRAMLENQPPSHKINYAFMLRNLRAGWTVPQRRAVLTFINSAAQFRGGNSYAKFLTNMRSEFLGAMTNAERAAVADISGENFNPVPDFPVVEPAGPGRKWTAADAGGALRGKANFERGRGLYFGLTCGKCHRFAGLGGDIGPDLTTLRNKFDQGYVVQAIVEPSQHISDQYASSTVALESGQVVTGLVIERDGIVEIYANDAKPDDPPVKVDADDIDSMEPSPISQMPVGLLDKCSPEEIRDLIAYLMSGGNPGDRRFK